MKPRKTRESTQLSDASSRETGSQIPPYELVVVTYKSAAQLTELLAGLPGDLPLAVSDNGSNVDGIRELIASRPNSRYIDAGGVGFSRAVNKAAFTSTYDYLVFLNPDSRPQAQTLEELVRDVAEDDRLASSSALPVGADGTPDIGAGGYEPTVRRTLVHTVGLHKVLPRIGLFAAPPVGSRVELDWLSAACMAVRRETFTRLGGFDETYFVYNEDMAYGRAARRAGLRQRLRTDRPVQHAPGGSGAPSAEMFRLRGASMSRYMRQEPARRARGVVGLLAAGAAGRILLETLRRNRPLAVGYTYYIRGLLTGRATVGGRPVY